MTTYPLPLIWPADTRAGLPAGRWRRLEDGRIEAVYESQEELGFSTATASVAPYNGSEDMRKRRRDRVYRDWLERWGVKQEALL